MFIHFTRWVYNIDLLLRIPSPVSLLPATFSKFLIMHIPRPLFSRLCVKPFFVLLMLSLASPFGGASTAYGQFTWQPGGPVFSKQLSKLYVDPLDSTLWVMGIYAINVNGQPAPKGIARIDANGELIDFPDPPYSDNFVILRWRGELFVGGYNGLARYDGNRWHKIDSNRNFSPFCLYPYQNKLLIGGVFADNKGDYENILMAYVPGSDTLVNSLGADTVCNKGFAVFDMAEYKGKLYIAGNFDPYPPQDVTRKEIACWTGSKWESLKQGITSGGLDFVGGLEVYNDTLFVAGYFNRFQGAPGNSIAKWDGQNWHQAGQGITSGGINDLNIYNGGLVAMGNFQDMDGYSCSGIGFYKNGQWCRNTVYNAGSFSGVDYAGSYWVTTANEVGLDTVHYLAKITSMGDCAKTISIVNTFSQKSLITVSPNPSAGNFVLRREGGSSYSPFTCRVTDLTGRLLWETKSNASELRIESAQWPAGMYLLYLQNEDGQLQMEKLLKE